MQESMEKGSKEKCKKVGKNNSKVVGMTALSKCSKVIGKIVCAKSSKK